MMVIRNAYNMVLHKWGHRLYRGLTEVLTEQQKGIAREIEQIQGEPFLQKLKDRWELHIKSSQMVRDILMVCI